jgi:hypothetical protein
MLRDAKGRMLLLLLIKDFQQKLESEGFVEKK